MTASATTTVEEFERLLRTLCRSVTAFDGDLLVLRHDLRSTTIFQVMANPQDVRRLVGQKARFFQGLTLLADQATELTGRMISIGRVAENPAAKATAALPAYRDNPQWPRESLLGLLAEVFALLFECEITLEEDPMASTVVVSFRRGHRNISDGQLQLMSDLVKTVGMANGVNLGTDFRAIR